MNLNVWLLTFTSPSVRAIGGMCQVYPTRDITLDRDVALKVLPEYVFRSPPVSPAAVTSSSGRPACGQFAEPLDDEVAASKDRIGLGR